MTKTDWVLMLSTVALNASASILVKKGAGALVGGSKLSGGLSGVWATIGPAVNVYTVLGIVLLGFSFVSYVIVLSKVQLSVAQPMLALSYILVGVSAHFIFGEALSWTKIVGIGVIILGVILVSTKA